MTLTQIEVDERVVLAFERIATALEQISLEQMANAGMNHAPNATYADPYPQELPPADEIADLPPVRPPVVSGPATPPAPMTGACPVHHTPWKLVPGGYSQKKQKAYNAFWACSTAGCNQRP